DEGPAMPGPSHFRNLNGSGPLREMGRHRRDRFEEPRADFFAVAGFFVVAALSFAAFVAVQGTPAHHKEVARAYSLPILAAEPSTDPVATASITPKAPLATAAAQQAPACDLSACGRAYRSFDPRDCSYQPFEGP